MPHIHREAVKHSHRLSNKEQDLVTCTTSLSSRSSLSRLISFTLCARTEPHGTHRYSFRLDLLSSLACSGLCCKNISVAVASLAFSNLPIRILAIHVRLPRKQAVVLLCCHPGTINGSMLRRVGLYRSGLLSAAVHRAPTTAHPLSGKTLTMPVPVLSCLLKQEKSFSTQFVQDTADALWCSSSSDVFTFC